MQAKPSPLEVVISPPGIQNATPGETIELHVVVTNKGDRHAIVELYLDGDEQFKHITGLSGNFRASCAIAPKEISDELTFTLEIAVDAKLETYNYIVVADSPQHYPEVAPITFHRQLKVVPQEHTAINVNDPTFFITPSSNTNKPLICKLHEPLVLEVTVENRSQYVDKFRLTCRDLEADWWTITYPTTGVEGTGLRADINALELNPGKSGKISLKFHPPADTLAGSYSPTLCLSSENFPDLKLLDLVYFQIRTNYDLNIELHTILGQVSYRPGKYELSLNNRGNIIRELTFGVESRDEEKLFTYQFEPTELKLLPSQSGQTNLTLKPNPWWRRHWLGSGQLINFKVLIQDKKNLPLPETFPQGTLIWKPRPWWQLLLLILLILGLLGGVGLIIWRILNPPELKIENFSANSYQLTEGEDQVALNWEIRNYKKLQQLIIEVSGTEKIEPITYDFRKGIPDTINKNNCRVQQNIDLICQNITTGINTKGNYSLKLTGLYQKGNAFVSETATADTPQIQVVINEKPIAEIVELKINKPQYQSGENILGSWKVTNYSLLKEIQIAGIAEDGTRSKPVTYQFDEGSIKNTQLKKSCQEVNRQQLQCTDIPIDKFKPGKYAFELKALPNNGSEKISVKKTEEKIAVLPKPIKIVSFTLNGSDQPHQSLKEGETAVLAWKVEGEDIQVKLLYRDVQPVDSLRLPVISSFPTLITLKVADKYGNSQETGFAIAVIPKVLPTPTPVVSPSPTPSRSSPFIRQ